MNQCRRGKNDILGRGLLKRKAKAFADKFMSEDDDWNQVDEAAKTNIGIQLHLSAFNVFPECIPQQSPGCPAGRQRMTEGVKGTWFDGHVVGAPPVLFQGTEKVHDTAFACAADTCFRAREAREADKGSDCGGHGAGMWWDECLENKEDAALCAAALAKLGFTVEIDGDDQVDVDELLRQGGAAARRVLDNHDDSGSNMRTFLLSLLSLAQLARRGPPDQALARNDVWTLYRPGFWDTLLLALQTYTSPLPVEQVSAILALALEVLAPPCSVAHVYVADDPDPYRASPVASSAVHVDDGATKQHKLAHHHSTVPRREDARYSWGILVLGACTPPHVRALSPALPAASAFGSTAGQVGMDVDLSARLSDLLAKLGAWENVDGAAHHHVSVDALMEAGIREALGVPLGPAHKEASQALAATLLTRAAKVAKIACMDDLDSHTVAKSLQLLDGHGTLAFPVVTLMLRLTSVVAAVA